MDIHDAQRQNHPSDSIPNAAYPDSGYRPSDSAHELPLLNTSSTTLPSSQHSPYPSSQQSHYLPGNYNHHTPTSPNGSRLAASQWQPDDALGPPPPYAPSQTPSSYSPLSVPPPTLPPSTPSSNPHLHTMPPGSSSSQYIPPSSPYSTQSSQFPPSYNPGGPIKLGPVAEARRRKRRKMRICVVATCLTLLFMIALVVGVALGVWRRVKDSDDDEY